MVKPFSAAAAYKITTGFILPVKTIALSNATFATKTKQLKNGTGGWKMFQNKPYYSENVKLQLLKKAPYEKLLEYLLMMTGGAKHGN